MVRVLEPWFESAGKRIVKAPKVYVRDSGILHALLNIPDQVALERHPKLGASWEGFVIEQLLNALNHPQAYYWRTQAGAELDLLLMQRGRRIGVEVKRADAPTITRSMQSAIQDLGLHRLLVVYPGTQAYKLSKQVSVLPLQDCLDALTWGPAFISEFTGIVWSLRESPRIKSPLQFD